MLQPKYTMTGFNWLDERGIEGIGFVKAVRTLLTNNIPSIIPDIQRAISDKFSALLADHKSVNGRHIPLVWSPKSKNIAGVRHSPVYPMIVKLTVEINALAFFGKDVCMFLFLGYSYC